MDSLRGIPVEYELDAFSMPSTGTTSCHPKNWLCRSERNSAINHMEIAPTLLPQNTRHTKLHGDSKHNPSHVQQHAAIWTSRYAISSPTLTSLNSTSLAAPKANYIQCCKYKTFFVVLLKKSFVIHLCCLKKYSVREINNFPKRYKN